RPERNIWRRHAVVPACLTVRRQSRATILCERSTCDSLSIWSPVCIHFVAAVPVSTRSDCFAVYDPQRYEAGGAGFVEPPLQPTGLPSSVRRTSAFLASA